MSTRRNRFSLRSHTFLSHPQAVRDNDVSLTSVSVDSEPASMKAELLAPPAPGRLRLLSMCADANSPVCAKVLIRALLKNNQAAHVSHALSR